MVAVMCLVPGTPPDLRRAEGKPAIPAARVDNGVRVWKDVRYTRGTRTRLDVYRPAARAATLAGVVVVHGGAWKGGDKARMSSIATRIARSGLVAYSVNYTLARRSRPGYPLQLRQLRRAVRWVRATSGRFRVNPKRIGALGTSAGGHLVSLLATSGHGPLNRGARVRVAAAWSAPHDLGALMETRMAASINNFLGCLSDPCPQREAAASPITHVSRDDPPMLLFNSRQEQIPASQARRMARRLSEARVATTLRLLPGTAHAMGYAATAREPTVRYLRRWLLGRPARGG